MNIFARTVDSFQNFAARLGLGAGSQNDHARYGFDFISRNRVQLEAMYRSSWVVGQAVDVVAEDMTREGIDIKGDIHPTDIEKINKALERLRVWDDICNTIKWARLYGGCLAVMLVDGQDVSTPLNLNSIGKGQFKGLMVLDRWLVQPSLQDLVTEYGPGFGMPRYYTVAADSIGLANQNIHHSRVIRIDGVDLPHWQRSAENLWGQSVIERLLDRLTAFDSTTAGAAQLVYKAHLRTYKVKDLRNIIATGGRAFEGLVKQIEHIRSWQSSEGMTLMDAEDQFEAHQYSFNGLSDMLLQFGQQLSGALQIPLVRLFGQSPAGLSSSGESDLRTYYDNIAQQQERRLRTPLTTLLSVVALSELGADLAEHISFDFTSLRQLDPNEKASYASNVTSSVLAAQKAGVIDKATALKELRQSSEITGIWSNISNEDMGLHAPDADARGFTGDGKGNPNHDPKNGQFTSAGSSSAPKVEMLSGKLETSDLIDAAIQRPNSGNKIFAVLAKVDPAVANKVKSVTGIDVTDFVHGIDEVAVRHIFKHHGDDVTESLRNQVAVTKEDIASLNEVLNNPDTVDYSGTLSDGTPTITLKKKVGDTIVCVQEVRTGRKKLAVKTMWKVRNVRTPGKP